MEADRCSHCFYLCSVPGCRSCRLGTEQTPRPCPTRLPAESHARHAPNQLLPLLGAQAQKTRQQQPRESIQRAHGEDMTASPPAVLPWHIICSLRHRLHCSQALLLSSPRGHKLLLAPKLHGKCFSPPAAGTEPRCLCVKCISSPPLSANSKNSHPFQWHTFDVRKS